MAETSKIFQRIVRSSLLIFIGNIIGVGALFVTRLISARFLNPGPYGLLVLAVGVINILTYVSLIGFPRGLGRQIPRSEDPSALCSTAIYISIIVGVLLSAVLFLGSGYVAKFISEPGFKRVIRIFVLAIPFFVFTRVTFGIFQGFEDSLGKVLAQNFSYQALVLTLVSISAVLEVNAFGVSVAWSSALILSALLSLLLLKKRIDRFSLVRVFRPEFLKNTEIVRKAVVFSFPLMLSGIIWQLLINFDNFMISYFLSSAQTGIYDASFTLGMSLRLFIGAFGFLILPVLSDLHNHSDTKNIKRIYHLSTKWMVFSTFPIYFLFVSEPTTLITLFFGGEYSKSGGLILILIASGFFVSTVFGVNGNGLTAIGHPRLVLLSNLIAMLLNIVLNFILIPRVGLIGAAIASFTALTSMNLVRGYFLYSRTGTHPFYKPLIVPILISFSVLLIIHKYIRELQLHPVAFLLLISLIHFIIVVASGGIEQEDLDLILTILNR